MFLSKRYNGVYYLWYSDELGKKHKVSTQSTLKSEALKYLQRFKRTEHEFRRKSRHKALSQFIDDFLTYSQETYSRGTSGMYAATLKRFQAVAGDCPLSSITPQDADQYKAERLKSISPVTVNIELRTLRAAFNVALRWRLIDSNPFGKVQLARLSEVQPVFFTKDDFQKLLSIIKENWLRELILFAVLTGARRGEIVNLRWQDVDLERKLILIQSNPTFKTKQGKRRMIPLSEVAFHLLQTRHGKSTSEYVFTLNDKKISEGWLSHKFKYYVYEARLKYDGLHFHSLRHTFASWLVQDGVSLYEVQKLLGHSNIAVTQVYSHLQPEHLHSTVNRISLALN